MTGQASSPPSIEPLITAPPFLTAQEHDAATSATPTSFADIPPRLVLALKEATVLIEPPISVGDVQLEGALKGEMWATEGALSFLPSSATSGGATGFSLPYPLIVLHAVSTSVPASINSAEGDAARRSIYCQLELPGGGEEGDDEEEDEGEGLREMWIVPAQDEEVDTLFQSLSHCASLQTSLQDGEDDDGAGGNPFAGMGPFGTGIAGGSMSGQFDDVNGEADGQDLSEAGRANLGRFEAMLGGGDDEEDYADADEEQPTSSTVSTSSNLLMLRTLPHPYPSLFTAPLLSSLLALLDAYAPLVGWDPSPEEGTMRVVFDNRKDAERRVTDDDIEKVKQVLDGLELEVLGGQEQDEGHQKPHLSVELLPNSIDVVSLLPRGLNHPAAPSTSSSTTTMTNSTAPAPLRRRSFAPSDLLQPPNTDRNFLISPPGSPPIGWEPIREDPPNRETLAGDLIEALMRLSGGGGRGGGREDDEEEEEEEEEKEERGQVSSTKASSTTNSPKPGEVKVVLQSDEQGGGPVVTVQSFDDDDDDGQEAAGSTSRPDITQVKATVESMTGGGSDDFGLAAGADGAGGGKRITPTGRPPLA